MRDLTPRGRVCVIMHNCAQRVTTHVPVKAWVEFCPFFTSFKNLSKTLEGGKKRKKNDPGLYEYMCSYALSAIAHNYVYASARC